MDSANRYVVGIRAPGEAIGDWDRYVVKERDSGWSVADKAIYDGPSEIRARAVAAGWSAEGRPFILRYTPGKPTPEVLLGAEPEPKRGTGAGKALLVLFIGAGSAALFFGASRRRREAAGAALAGMKQTADATGTLLIAQAESIFADIERRFGVRIPDADKRTVYAEGRGYLEGKKEHDNK